MNNNKTVVIIGTAHPLRGGLAAYNERLAKAFIERGDKVIIYTFSLQYPGIIFPGKTQYSSEPPPKNLDIRISVNSINPFNWIKIGRKIKKLKPDLVIVKYWIPFIAPCLGTITRIIRKNRHSKIVSILDNIIPHEVRIGDKLLSKYFVKSVDGFIAMSQSVKEDLKLFDKTKPCTLSPHPLYDNFGEAMSKEKAYELLNLDKSKKYLLFFGFIRDYKGLDILLEAMNNEDIKKSNIKLIVAGEYYTDSKPYYEIIEKHKLHDKLVLKTDFIADSDVAKYFCAADIIVQPYKTATQSGVTQIAYHFNKPMIVTDVGGLAEIIPHNKAGYVVDVDPKKISQSILNFYNEDREKEMIKFVKKEKEKYTWDKMIDAVNMLFE